MKIYNQDIKSEIEAWYLKGDLSKFYGECDVFVNPKSKFLYDKIVIITDLCVNYKRFVGKNFIISRFPLPINDYVLIPYTVSSLLSVSEPFRRVPQILYPYSLNKDNCEIEGNTLKLKYNYISVEQDSYLGYLTQTGFIASIIGLV